MAAFADFLDNLGAERIQVTGIARGDKGFIHHDCAVFPFAAGIFDIGTDGLIACDIAVLDHTGLNKQPWRMADRGQRLAAVEEVEHETHRISIGAQNVGIDLAARQHQRIIILHFGVLDMFVDRDAFTPIILIPALDVVITDGEDGDVGSLFPKAFDRRKQLRFLKAVRGKHSDFTVFNLRHGDLLFFNSEWCWTNGRPPWWFRCCTRACLISAKAVAQIGRAGMSWGGDNSNQRDILDMMAGQERLAGWKALGAVMAFAMLAALPVHAAPVVPQPGAPASFADLVERLSPAVVNIRTETQVAERLPQFPPGSPLERFNSQLSGPGTAERSLGSGFIIDPAGIIVTNNHVIADADAIEVALTNGVTLKAEVVGRDPATDLAVLRVQSDEPLPAVPFGPSETRRPGDWVVAIGNPFGLGNSVSVGVVSARNRDISAGTFDDFIQTDAAINQGNSGGPLFDLDGQVVGVNSAILSPDGGNIGISFAIPSELTQQVVGQILEFGEIRRGWLGVGTQPVSLNVARSFGLDEARGAIVVRVEPGSPAARAGLQEGDLITRLGSREVENDRVLTRLSADAEIGARLPLEIIRRGESQTLEVQIARRPETIDAAITAAEPSPDLRNAQESALGVSVGPLNEAERRRHRVPAQVDGVVVLAVNPASAAFGKVQVGDVIEEVAFTPVNDMQGFATAVRVATAQGDNVLLKLRRRGELYFESVAPVR